MNNSYTDLVKQTFHFPQEGFHLEEDYLQYNHVDLKALIDKYGTPMKVTYLPKIGMQINKAKQMFANAFKKHKYEGEAITLPDILNSGLSISTPSSINAITMFLPLDN